MESASNFKKKLTVNAVAPMSKKITRFFSYHIERRYRKRRVFSAINKDLVLISKKLESNADVEPIDTICSLALKQKGDHPQWAKILPAVVQLASKTLKITAYREQIKAALHMLYGSLVEVETGEGKTLSIAISAACAAMSGEKVHVITANDYLAQRDLEANLPLFSALGLTASFITSISPLHERRLNYLSDIIYTTPKEVAADFLRDQVSLKNHNHSRESAYLSYLTRYGSSVDNIILQSSKNYVFIDEVDSCLIDEAITPLILSRVMDKSEFFKVAKEVWSIALSVPSDLYKVNLKYKKCLITGDLEAFLKDEHELWFKRCKRGYRKEILQLIPTALEANHVYKNRVDYKVSDKKIVIIDQASGRLMENRSWGKGLHQFIELKEGIHNDSETTTEAKITFQDYFKLYDHIAGASGTLKEERRELWNFYETPIVKIERHFPSRRKHSGVFLESCKQDQLARLLKTVQAKRKTLQPVLVGCSSVESSLEVFNYLQRHGIVANLLNADSEESEASIVKEAGRAGKVTVGTQMVGRGTDIKLDDLAKTAGGLCTILLEFHYNARVDRQFFGRSARQEDPGEKIAIYSVEDGVLKSDFFKKLVKHGLVLWLMRPWLLCKIKMQQKAQMRKSRSQRYNLQKSSEHFEQKISYIK